MFWKTNYGLALWWGSARWFVHIWVIKYLEEKDIKITEISWTSMWAIVWAFLAFWKNSSEMLEIAKEFQILICKMKQSCKKIKNLFLRYKDWRLKNKIKNSCDRFMNLRKKSFWILRFSWCNKS